MRIVDVGVRVCLAGLDGCAVGLGLQLRICGLEAESGSRWSCD